MRLSAVFLALSAGPALGPSAPAVAQVPLIATYQVAVADPFLAPGESTSVSVLASISPGPGPFCPFAPPCISILGLSQGGFGISGTSAAGASGAWSGNTLDPPYNFPAGTSPGVASGLNVGGIVWGMGFLLSPPHPSPNSPDAVWTGVFTAGALEGEVNLAVTSPTATTVWFMSFGGLLYEATYASNPGRSAAITISGCYADCDRSGTLSVADFGCFQTAFVAGDPYADCDLSGALTVADFGCFQTAFVAGCP